MAGWLVYGVSTIFQLYRGGQFYWWGTPEYLEKTTDLTLLVMKKNKRHLLGKTRYKCKIQAEPMLALKFATLAMGN